MLGGMVVLVAAISGAQLLTRHRIPKGLEAVLILLLALGVYALYVRLAERRPVDELSPASVVPQLLSGLALGFALFSIVIGVLALTGNYHFLGFASAPGLLTDFAVAAVVAVIEELLFRGFLFRVVQSIGGTWIGIAVSAIVFGALHAINPHATVVSAAAIALEAGVLLGIAYTVTRRLWLPIGIHIGWNFTEGSIFGVSVSGHATTPGLLRGAVSGPDLLTGGAFGIEGSLLAVVVCGAASALFIVYALRKGRIVPMPHGAKPRSR